ncbi:hypothetical protein [Frankia sp. ACN1ag]|uniref:hypothetical protein n=1 Tax=Frankia sp. ACN1ag TaxID=102891 RepID=UPI0006DC26DB|nr:hypothetical protein [Frankia sp. ACN1ag]KQC35021.1 hypothetical protein UK82_28545 [Frankia sp. ACN1ag]
MTSDDDHQATRPDDPAALLRDALADALEVLEALPPAARAAAAHQARRVVGEDAQRRLAGVYADALDELVVSQGTYAAAAAAVAEAGAAAGDATVARVDGEAVRQALIRARRAAG